ncbi:MAG: DUF2809 domain-containing protein [Oscillospiraceae bacterium]|nr:DUF2809 domain-containing protein [Oscillospiraceae bacterium]
MIKKRIINTAAFLILLLTEVLIALYVHDDFIRPYFGDVLVVILIYFFVRIFFTEWPRLLPLYVFLFAAAVEGLQYISFVERIGLAGNAFFATVLGTSFSWWDMLCYAAGCVPLAVIEIIKYMRNQKEITP